MTFFNFKNQNGQSLIELLVAFGLMTLILTAVITGLVASREGVAQEGERLVALGYAREAGEAVRSVREGGWQNVATNGSYYPAISGSAWSLVSGSETTGGFLREIIIQDSERD